MHDGSASTAGTEEQSHQTEEPQDNDSLSLRIRLLDGKVSKISNTVIPSHFIVTKVYMYGFNFGRSQILNYHRKALCKKSTSK